MIKNAILYFFIITTLLYGLRILHYKGLLKNKGYYAKYKTIFCEKNNFNVLFLGSSRVEMHYDTGLFDSLTKQNSFNLGTAGATPHTAFAVLKTYLQKSKAPNWLIYEVDYHALKNQNEGIMDFNNYFPFLSNKTLREEFTKIDRRMKQFYYNPYYSWPFTGIKNLSTGIRGWLNIPGKNDSMYYKGFLKEVFRPEAPYVKTQNYYSWFEKSNRDYMDSIIWICKKKNIKICLMSSPMFAGGKIGLLNKKQITDQLHNIADINHISYDDLSSLPFCNEHSVFCDNYHLNYRGARKFTIVLSQIFNNKIRNIPLN